MLPACSPSSGDHFSLFFLDLLLQPSALGFLLLLSHILGLQGTPLYRDYLQATPWLSRLLSLLHNCLMGENSRLLGGYTGITYDDLDSSPKQHKSWVTTGGEPRGVQRQGPPFPNKD